MKKLILIIALAAISFGATAQSMKVQSAYSDLKNNRLGYAKKNIDDACQNESTMNDAKTWHYAGLIYAKLVEEGKANSKAFNKAKIEEPIDVLAEKAKNALIKSIELEKAEGKSEYMGVNVSTLNYINIQKLENALSIFNGGKYAESIPLFEEVLNNAKIARNAEVASKAQFCIAMAYDATKQKDKAAEIYRTLVKEKSIEEAVYINLFLYNKQNKETEKAINVLKHGHNNIPKSYQILGLLAGAYTEAGNKEEALKCTEKLKTMAEGKPEVMVIVGDILRDGGDKDGAISMYNNALAAKSDLYTANFSLGVLHFNAAIDAIEKANALPLSATQEYDALTAKYKESFREAIPFFEKVLSVKPNDIKSINALKNIYSKLEMTDKYKEMEAKFNALMKK